jgi:hypothetical protein
MSGLVCHREFTKYICTFQELNRETPWIAVSAGWTVSKMDDKVPPGELRTSPWLHTRHTNNSTVVMARKR